MHFNEASLVALISLGRQRKRISTEDLRQAFPIDQMTIEDITNLVKRLEEADIDLDIDQILLMPRRPVASRAPIATSKHAQAGLPEVAADVREKPVSSPELAVGSTAKTRAVGTSIETAPAHALILVFALVIAALVLVAVWGS
jgi:hypothetical protein